MFLSDKTVGGVAMDSKTEKPMNPAKLLEGLALTDRAIKINNEKTKLLKELRRTLARKAISLGILDGRLRHGQPCPLCGHPTSIFDARDLACRICKYDARGASATWERLHGRKA